MNPIRYRHLCARCTETNPDMPFIDEGRDREGHRIVIWFHTQCWILFRSRVYGAIPCKAPNVPKDGALKDVLEGTPWKHIPITVNYPPQGPQGAA